MSDRRRVFLLVDAAVFIGLAIWTIVYVTAEDSYRQLGVSRWNTYDAKPLTVVAVAASMLTAGLAVYAAVRRPGLLRIVIIAAVVTLVLNYFLMAAMSN